MFNYFCEKSFQKTYQNIRLTNDDMDIISNDIMEINFTNKNNLDKIPRPYFKRSREFEENVIIGVKQRKKFNF